tara:strand:- start:433 stop:1086 length:654 start_codon:yes stop_codon:yes gene_type:complete
MKLLLSILSIFFLFSCGSSSSDDSIKENLKFLEKRYIKLADSTSINDQKEKKNVAQATKSLAKSLKGLDYSDNCKIQEISFEQLGSFKSIFSVFTNLNLTSEQNAEMYPYWVIECSEKKNAKGIFRYSVEVHDMFLSDEEVILLENLSKNDNLNFSANIASSSANISKYDFYIYLKFKNMPYETEFCIPKSKNDTETTFLDCQEEIKFNDKKTIKFW